MAAFTVRDYQSWRDAPTDAAALDVLLAVAGRPLERHVPGTGYGGQCPDEWEPYPEPWEEEPEGFWPEDFWPEDFEPDGCGGGR